MSDGSADVLDSGDESAPTTPRSAPRTPPSSSPTSIAEDNRAELWRAFRVVEDHGSGRPPDEQQVSGTDSILSVTLGASLVYSCALRCDPRV